jgi:hypothetical protein
MSTQTTVKVTKQQLFSFLAVHARIPPNEALLKKQQYALFDDGVAFCRMFNSIFVQRPIVPIITSSQTSSASSRSTRNWKALHRAMVALGVPVEVVPRDMYRPNAVDSVGGYSGLVFFYFMHHLSKRRDFSAEFSSDVTGHLMTFLQSVDSIRSLVLGGAVMLDSLPRELHHYCSTPPHHEDIPDSPGAQKMEAHVTLPSTAAASSNISSVEQEEDDEGSEMNLRHARLHGSEGPSDTPHPTNAARSLFHDAAPPFPVLGSHSATTPQYLLESPAAPALPQRVVEERFFEGEQFADSAPEPHAASPKLLTRRFGSASHHQSHDTSPPRPVSTMPDNSPSHDRASSGVTDVNAAAAQLQRLLLKRHLSPEASDEAQALLWGILSAYHVAAMRDTGSSASPSCAHDETLRARIEDTERANEKLRLQLEHADSELQQHEEQSKLLVASHNAAVARFTDDIVRLRREHEASLLQRPLQQRCNRLMDLCATLRALDHTSMELISSNIDDTDDGAQRIEELLNHRAVLQQRAAGLAAALHSESADAVEPSPAPLVAEAMEERIRSVTASRDQLLEELQRLSTEASVWCEEATDLRKQQRDWETMRRRVEELETDVLRRNNVIDELRSKLAAAVSELDDVRRASVQREREHSAIWSVPRPQVENSVNSSSASPAARTPQTEGGHAPYALMHGSRDSDVVSSVPRFRLSSPRPFASPSPRAPTEARVVEGPYNMTLFASSDLDHAKVPQHPKDTPLVSVSLRDLDAIDGILC